MGALQKNLQLQMQQYVNNTVQTYVTMQGMNLSQFSDPGVETTSTRDADGNKYFVVGVHTLGSETFVAP